MFLKCSYISIKVVVVVVVVVVVILVIRYSSTVKKSITVETSIRYSIQKFDHLTADRVMTANIKSLVFYVIMTPFPLYKNMPNFSG